MDKKRFYYAEMKHAEKEGNLLYASRCKEDYQKIVMSEIIKPYHLYIHSLRQYPIVVLN